MSKIIENRGSVKVEYRNHSFEKYTDHYAKLQRLAAERGITINESVNRFVDFILAEIGDNEIIHY